MPAPTPPPSLHQSAVRLLKRAKVAYNPAFSPLSQLMLWCLKAEKDQQFPELRREQQEALEETLGWAPQEVEAWLLAPGDNSPQSAPALRQDALEGLNPVEGARLLLAVLHDQLPTYKEGYPPPSHSRHPVVHDWSPSTMP